ncbi:hypothetical protein BGW38_009268 [Lunasporangiospora selenospora]|uniref:Uncharacterized protein n=1 Tax=Lunasporangiospora selenospora TaxID=979761 RepID=A0A9P6FXP3_9FUNG|nr:hypothetical protein BGW38_009268 [Lunasporangiospora selenospora]
MGAGEQEDFGGSMGRTCQFPIVRQSSALFYYSKLLRLHHLAAKRRQSLQNAHDSFMKNRLMEFWASSVQQLSVDKAQRELEASSSAIAKKTAVLALEASLSESAKNFEALKKKNVSANASLIESRASPTETVSIDNAATDVEKCMDADKQPCEPDTDAATEDKTIAAQGQRVALLPSVLNDLSGVQREIVLSSSIINTVALSGRQFSISKKILQESRLPPLDTKPSDHQSTKALMRNLLTTLHPAYTSTSNMNSRGKPQFQSLKKRVWTLLSQEDEETDTASHQTKE